MNIAALSAPAARLLVALLTGSTSMREALGRAGITRRQTAWQVRNELVAQGVLTELPTASVSLVDQDQIRLGRRLDDTVSVSRSNLSNLSIPVPRDELRDGTAELVAANATHVAESATPVAESATRVAASATSVADSATALEDLIYLAEDADSLPTGGAWQDAQSPNRMRRFLQMANMRDAWTYLFPTTPIADESLKRLLQLSGDSAVVALTAIQKTAEANARSPIGYVMKVAQSEHAKRPASIVSLVPSPYGEDGMRDATEEDRAAWRQAEEAALAIWGSDDE